MRVLNVICFLLMAAAVWAGEPAKQGFYFGQNLGFMYNPLGAEVASQIYYRIPLSESRELLWEGTKIDFALQNSWTPTDDALGAAVTISPIAVFDLMLYAGYICEYKTLGFGPSVFPSSSADISPEAMANTPKTNLTGLWLKAAPTLKAQVGPVIIANTTTFNYLPKKTPGGWYYEARADATLKDQDLWWVNDTFLLYQFSKEFMAGLNHWIQGVASTGYLSERLTAAAIYAPRLTDNIDYFAVAMAGSFFQDHYFTGKLFIAIQTGITVRL